MKQVIVVNEALRLPKGKLAAQVAHAAVAAFLKAQPNAQREWLADGMTKIVLKCDSEDTLMKLLEDAVRSKLPAALIRDAGHTVVAAGTVTCLGIGPADDASIDAVTGTLKLMS